MEPSGVEKQVIKGLVWGDAIRLWTAGLLAAGFPSTMEAVVGVVEHYRRHADLAANRRSASLGPEFIRPFEDWLLVHKYDPDLDIESAIHHNKARLAVTKYAEQGDDAQETRLSLVWTPASCAVEVTTTGPQPLANMAIWSAVQQQAGTLPSPYRLTANTSNAARLWKMTQAGTLPSPYRLTANTSNAAITAQDLARQKALSDEALRKYNTDDVRFTVESAINPTWLADRTDDEAKAARQHEQIKQLGKTMREHLNKHLNNQPPAMQRTLNLNEPPSQETTTPMFTSNTNTTNTASSAAPAKADVDPTLAMLFNVGTQAGTQALALAGQDTVIALGATLLEQVAGRLAPQVPAARSWWPWARARVAPAALTAAELLRTESGRRVAGLVGAVVIHAALTHAPGRNLPGASIGAATASAAAQANAFLLLREVVPDPAALVTQVTQAAKGMIAAGQSAQSLVDALAELTPATAEAEVVRR